MADQTLVKRIKKYIEDHIDEDLTLEKIANEFHYSKFYLGRVFEQEQKDTMYQYIKNQRLTRAAQTLLEEKTSITEIAFNAHYASQQAFYLAFQTIYHCSPSTYRKRGGKVSRKTMCCSSTMYFYRGGIAA